MKRTISLLIAVIITMLCTVFPVSATQEAKVKSIEIKSCPDKLTYVENIDTDWKASSYSKDYKDEDERRKDFELEFKFDLSGMSVMATYEDDTTEEIPVSRLTLTVLDNVKLGEIANDIDAVGGYSYNIDVVYEKLYRDYTVEVEYMGATDTFDVSLVEETSLIQDDDSHKYEFVSFTPPNRKVYDIDTECSIEINDGDIPREYEYIEIDATGMTATLRNCDTGEEVVFYEEDISAYIVNYPEESGSLKTGEHMALGEVYIKESEYSTQCVDFEFPVTLIKSSEGETIPNENNASADTYTTGTIILSPVIMIIIAICAVVLIAIVIVVIVLLSKKRG